MNHRVPDFEMDDRDYGIPRLKKSASMVEDDEIMELLWQNGQVVMQSQNQRSFKKSQPVKFPIEEAAVLPEQSKIRSSAPADESTAPIFIQEDEMASWLHYPLDDFCADLLDPAPCVNAAPPPARLNSAPEDRPAAAKPPIPPTRRAELDSKANNFVHLSRKPASEYGTSSNRSAPMETTVVDSSDTPAVGHQSSFSPAKRCKMEASTSKCRTIGGAAVASTSAAGEAKEQTTCEFTVSSSPGGSVSGGSGSADRTAKLSADNRKRKGIEGDDTTECQSEDVEFEYADTKKAVRGPTAAKRTRAAEVHNLSERRRRDRINEKMKALQELIPRCNKSDKASMLDEAIEYLKSLQLQVQMMSMGCSMVPMLFPGFQQYMTQMGMGMGMGMDMGMNRPMMSFPSVLTGSNLPATAAAAHLGQRYPMPAFHMPHMPAPDSSRIQAPGQQDPAPNSLGTQTPNQPRVPNFADSYQQYFHQMPFHPAQNQAMRQQNTDKPSANKGMENHEEHHSG